MNAPIAFDTETALIVPGLLAPPMVCLSVAHEDGHELIHHTQAREWIVELLESDRVLVGANVAFDMGVIASKWPELLPLIFEVYEADRVTDVLIREKLQHIAIGVYRGYETTEGSWRGLGYSLEELAARRLGKKLDKDTWRLRYGELIDVPITFWPQGAQDYAIEDAVSTREAYLDQGGESGEWIVDEYRQARAAWWLQLMSAWGLRTDPEAVKLLAARLQKRYDEVADELIECGLLRVEVDRDAAEARKRLVDAYAARGLALPHTPSGKPRMGVKQLRDAGDPLLKLYADLNAYTRKNKCTPAEAPDHIIDPLIDAGLAHEKVVKNTKIAADLMRKTCAEKGLALVLTEKEGVKLDRDTCESVGHPDLELYAELSGLTTKLSNFVALLERGTRTPIQAHFETLLETGRTSSSPNVQNLPRKGGVRECFIPRDGMVYAAADYSGFELRTVAQVCLNLFGFSRLATALNKGFDPHLEIARRLVGCSYEEAAQRLAAGDDEIDTARQVGKVANFGFPGGLGIATFVLYARKSYGVIVTEEEAAALKQYWLDAWPEFKLYFKWIGDACDTPMPRIEQFYVQRYRANVSFCQACNTLFQGLAADAAKRAGFLIAKGCYVDESSPLFGSRMVNFVHDEFIVECHDDERAHDVAVEISRLMVEGAKPFLPDLEVVAEPYLMRRWSKKAKPIFRVIEGEKRLVPWDLDVKNIAA